MISFAFGIGVGTRSAKGEWLEAFYPDPKLGAAAGTSELWRDVADICGYASGNAVHVLDATLLERLGRKRSELACFRTATRPVVATFLATDTAPTTVPELYLKLHLLSHRLVRPHGTNLTGLFKILPNVAWTSAGALDVAELPAATLAARMRGEPLAVWGVDKFPRMTDYVVPGGVRIADASRVRLGAYLGAGTTVMHEGFINYNAGCEGPNMVEGRISAGVFVGAGSDLGGGCSTMGTLSGGGDIVITIGKNCLIGANAGIGIPLGDNCTVESGLYVTAASKVKLVRRDGGDMGIVKVRELAGRSGLLFRRNSLSGGLECLANKGAIELNAELHSNN